MNEFTFEEYRRLAQRTSPDDGHDRTDNAIFGLIGETGEIADLWKKWKYQSTPGTLMPREKMLEEAGDVLWYLAELATGLKIDLAAVAGVETFREFDAELLRRRNYTRNNDIRHMILAMNSRASSICYFVGRKENKRTKAQIKAMLTALGTLALACGESTYRVARANIQKLRERYPDGFDARKSMGRYE